ncbi:MAG: hypothetical protein P4L27_10765 [Ignavibacteriaceae bacterium]|nr:hypothetical protein [Ignavibacteriaceae bacterium]
MKAEKLISIYLLNPKYENKDRTGIYDLVKYHSIGNINPEMIWLNIHLQQIPKSFKYGYSDLWFCTAMKEKYALFKNSDLDEFVRATRLVTHNQLLIFRFTDKVLEILVFQLTRKDFRPLVNKYSKGEFDNQITEFQNKLISYSKR